MGGKRKSTKAPPKKRAATLPKVFKCPYCAHDASCEVKLDRTAETGSISCRVCGESFQCRISYLSDPVDVYCEWIDASDAARDGAGRSGGGGGGGGAGSGGGGSSTRGAGGGGSGSGALAHGSDGEGGSGAGGRSGGGAGRDDDSD